MKTATLFTWSLLAAVSCAVPLEERGNGWNDKCLTQKAATNIVNDFITVLEHTSVKAANATAQKLFAEAYVETSDSILALQGRPLGRATFVGKQAYINAVLNAPSIKGINTLEAVVAGCSKVLWYWRFAGIGSAKYPVKGFNYFTITKDLQVQALAVEFNDIAWGLDIGRSCFTVPTA